MTRRLFLAGVCFVLSGAGALVDQVAWQRLLALSSGVAVHSVAAITAAFMAGLGIGSELGGRLSMRLSPRQAVLGFAVVEAGVAAFAAISVPLFYDVLYVRWGFLYGDPAAAFVIHLLSLLVPTTLMGMSLPLLTRGLVLSASTAARTIGLLYGANALGAATGALLTPWVLLRFFGVSGAVGIGAALSAVAAVGALAIARTVPEAPALESSAPDHEASSALAGDAQGFGIWVALYALSGFLSLSLELVWFRVLDVLVKGAAFTFGTLLAIYLTGLAAGTFASTAWVSRLRRPLHAFLACQATMLATTLLAHVLLQRLPARLPVIGELVAYGSRPEGPSIATFDPALVLVLYMLLPLVLFGPATFCMGFGFPILQRAVQTDPETTGRKVGLLQAANIAGCTAGSLLTGLVFFDRLGTAGTFRALGAICALVCLAGAWRLGSRGLGAMAALVAALALLVPDNERFWLRLHGDPPPADALAEEDAASVTALTPRRPAGYSLWINGRTNSWLPFGSLHTVLGAAPALIHPEPRTVAIVGLGSGDTAWAAGVREETQTVTVFEIATSQPRLLQRVRDRPRMSRLDAFLSDPRVVLVEDDGRRRLEHDGVRYDIVETDAIFPDSSLSGHLYSLEFYQVVARALKPGGVLCAWAPTERSRATARRAFAHAMDVGGLLMLSDSPLEIARETWLGRLESAHTRDYLGAARLGEIRDALERAVLLPPLEGNVELNRDLDPADEYARPAAEGIGGSRRE